MESNDEMKALGADEAPHDELHGALCALALGELHGDEARALVARLASEPELAAQYDEVRATITLVRTSLAQPEALPTLPTEHMERVLSGARAHAAAPAPIHDLAWHRRPAVRLAASLVLCAGAAFIGLRLMQTETSNVRPGDVTELGRRDAPVDGPPERRQAVGEGVDTLPTIVEPTADAVANSKLGFPVGALGTVLERAERAVALDPRVAQREQPVAPLADGAGEPGGTAQSELAQGDQVLLKELKREFDAVVSLGLEKGVAAGQASSAYVVNAIGIDGSAVGGSVPGQPGVLDAQQLLALGYMSTGSPTPDPSHALVTGVVQEAERKKALTLGRGPDRGAGGGSSGPASSGPAPSGPIHGGGPGAPPATPSRAASNGFTGTEQTKAPSPDHDLVSKLQAGAEPAPEPTPAGRPVDLPELSVAQDDLTQRLRAFRDDDQGGNPRLSDEQLTRVVEQEWQRLHAECQRYPNERPRDMYFRFWGDNAFVRTGEDAQSTFGADVDTASYALARRYLREGRAPERAQIRTEEFVNAFTPDLAPPTEETFGLHVELAPTPFGEDANHWLVRVGVRGKEVAKGERQPLNLTFVVDTSGSMREGNRLELVKHAMRLLVTQLDYRDTIAIVAYSNEARQVLAPTSAAHRDLIESAIHPLSPNGSTNAEAGLRMGYALAETTLTSGAHSRVVFLSDGVANVGQTDQDRINGDIKRFRDAGIYLNTIGVGMNNHNDAFLEQLANKGDGICDYVDDAAAAEKAIVERFTGAFVPIASDVKLQVEFDPAQVLRWRQLGYENRAIADHDFRNDKIDAGEVGAGHQVTCLYEVELADGLDKLDPAKALATLRVRWKAPKGARQDPNEIDVFEREATLGFGAAASSFRAASPGFRRSALAAQFAEFLRRSSHARMDDYVALAGEGLALIEAAPRATPPGSGVHAGTFTEEVAELADLVRRADGLGFGQRPPVTDLERTLDEYRRCQYLRATLQELRTDGDPMRRQIEEMNKTLEEQIRDLLRRDLQQRRG